MHTQGEAYKIEHAVSSQHLDYGVVRVVDDKAVPVTLKNTGKYAIQFNYVLRNAQARELFTVVPEQGSVDPGKEATVQVGGG